MTPFAELDQLYQSASGGEWEAQDRLDGKVWSLVADNLSESWKEKFPGGRSLIVAPGEIEEPNARFIAAIHNAWPHLRSELAELDRLRLEVLQLCRTVAVLSGPSRGIEGWPVYVKLPGVGT